MIKKLIVLLTIFVLFGCGSDAPSIFKSEMEGSAKNFEDDIHGTYASTYTPLKPENIVIGMGAGSISNWMRKLPELM